MASFRNVLAQSPKARVSFKFQADDGEYRASVQGIPLDYSLDALRDHLKGKDCTTSTKVDGRVYSATPKGDKVAPFLTPAGDDAVPEPVKKRTKASIPTPSSNGEPVANGESK